MSEEEEVDGVMRCRVRVVSAKEEEDGAGSTTDDEDVLWSSTGEEARTKGPAVSVVVAVVVEPWVGKRYGRPPMYKVPKARRSK